MRLLQKMIARPILSGLFVAFIWGLNVVMMKIAMADLPPLLFNSLRFAVLGFILLPFVKINWRGFRKFLPLALIMGMGHFYLLSLGLTFVPSYVASFCLLLGGPFSAILGYFLLSERLSKGQMLAIFVATLGATVPSLLSGKIVLQLGMLFVVLSTFLWALGNIQVRKLTSISTLAIQFWIAIITAPLSFLIFWLTEDNPSVMAHITAEAIFSILYVVLASSLLGYTLWYRLIHTHGINRIAPLALLQPIFTLAFGYLLIAESANLWQWLGGLVTLIAIYTYYRIEMAKDKLAQPDKAI